MTFSRIGVLLVAVATLFPAVGSAQGVYFSRESVLKAFFADSERVSYERLNTALVAPGLQERLGYIPKRADYVIFVARTGERIDGYAVIDEEVGQHLPITFAVKFTPDGAVARTEIMAYREAYGEEIRQKRFRQQFTGRRSGDPLRLGEEVAAISGATISVRAMIKGVRRATALVETLRSRTATRLAAHKEPAGSAR